MRKIIQNALKDENGQYLPLPISKPPKKHRDPKASDISLDDLMDKHLLLLYRETRMLLEESSGGKLSKDSANSMRENMKLIVELKKKEKELLDNLSNEELEELKNKDINISS